MPRTIITAAFVFLAACGDGQAREMVYGYYASLFDSETPRLSSPPKIEFPLFPREIWEIILKDADLSVSDLASIAQTCKGLELLTHALDESYIPRLAYQSRDLAFFMKYMFRPIMGLKTPLSPLEDLYNMLGSYKAIYDSGYMTDVFTPERIKAYNEAIIKISYAGMKAAEYSYEQREQALEDIQTLLKGASFFIFPFQYTNCYWKKAAVIEFFRKHGIEYYCMKSFYYPLSAPEALGKDTVYLNERWWLLLSKAQVLPPLNELTLRERPLTHFPLWLAQITTLVDLNLNNTGLSELPIEVSKLKKLEYLHLAHNKFTHVPAVIGKLTKLKNLRLERNSIKDMSISVEYLKSLTNLYHLRLYDNQISDINFLSQLTHLTKLESIELYNNKIHFIPEWITSLRDANDNTLYIELQGNSLWSSVVRYWLPRNFLPSVQKRPEYNSNPKVKIFTD